MTAAGTAPATTSQSQHWAARTRGLGGTARDTGTQGKRAGGDTCHCGKGADLGTTAQGGCKASRMRGHVAGHAVSPSLQPTLGDATTCTGTPTLPGTFCNTEAEALRPQMKPAAQGRGTLSQATPTDCPLAWKTKSQRLETQSRQINPYSGHECLGPSLRAPKACGATSRQAKRDLWGAQPGLHDKGVGDILQY